MTAKIEGKELVIRLPLEKTRSVSGKSIVIASTHGNADAGLTFEGKPVKVGVNAYIPAS